MNVQELKGLAVSAIDESSDELIRIGRELYAMPETGFKEYKTSAYVRERLESLGLEVFNNIAITGLKAVLHGRKPMANVAISGELDALHMPSHKYADPLTGAAHGCGHHAQLVVLIGVAMALIKTEIIEKLDGNITLFAVPAEEAIELDFRQGLQREGKIKYLGGKQEFIRLGAINDVDMILCSHPASNQPSSYFGYGQNFNGMINKVIRFHGKSSHAALAPELGINALQAAVCAINNINALRESFHDNDHVRIHYIITKGGDSPNIIPNDVRMEMGVRAATTDAMLFVNQKVNAAINMGAQAVGATVEIEDLGAYLPLIQNKMLNDVFVSNALLLSENVENLSPIHKGSSTDAGDFASVVPTIHPVFGGAEGLVHTDNFIISDERLAYVESVKAMTLTVIDLLADNAEKAREVKANSKTVFKSKEEYEDFFHTLFSHA